MKKRLCSRVARAIVNLHKALWNVDNNKEDKETIEGCCDKLSTILHKHGYEFSTMDSSRIKKIKP